MKRFSSSAVLSVLLAASNSPIAQAQNCVYPTERAAFELIALKNTLMVAALSCDQDNEYNDFMTRFQPYLQTQQTTIDHYFQRMNGGTAQLDEDAFMTQLSNEESQESLTLGPQYCPGASALFDQILSLRDEPALAAFAATNAPAQGGPDTCGSTTAGSGPPAPALPPPDPVELPTPPAASPAPAAPSSQASIAQRASEELVVSPSPAWHPPARLEAAPLAAPPGVRVAEAGRPGFAFPRRTFHYAIPARHILPATPASPAKTPAKPPAKSDVAIVQI